MLALPSILKNDIGLTILLQITAVAVMYQSLFRQPIPLNILPDASKFRCCLRCQSSETFEA